MNRATSTVLAITCFLLAAGASASSQPKSGLRLPEKIDPAVAEKRARERVGEILSGRPERALTNNATLRIRNPDGKWLEIPLRIAIVPGSTNWHGIYEAASVEAFQGGARLTIRYTPGEPNEYALLQPLDAAAAPRVISGNDAMIPFAGSDFWLADLGLEFFHWTNQRFLRNEIRRGQSCDVIESVNPAPAPGTYARVVTWIDVDTGGIVLAEAFDRDGTLLKRFAPKSFEKVDGQWQLQEMEIQNLRSRTRTRIEFQFED